MIPAVSGSGSTVAMRKEASGLRKTLKPLMEKRRRARINACLNQLKKLIIPLMGEDSCRYSKLEKADILEMTLRLLTHGSETPTNDPTTTYGQGYDTYLQRFSGVLPRTSLDRDICARVRDFIQQSLRSSSPVCPACRPHVTNALSRIDVVRREKRASVTLARAQCAPHAAARPMWRPW